MFNMMNYGYPGLAYRMTTGEVLNMVEGYTSVFGDTTPVWDVKIECISETLVRVTTKRYPGWPGIDMVTTLSLGDIAVVGQTIAGGPLPGYGLKLGCALDLESYEYIGDINTGGYIGFASGQSATNYYNGQQGAPEGYFWNMGMYGIYGELGFRPAKNYTTVTCTDSSGGTRNFSMEIPTNYKLATLSEIQDTLGSRIRYDETSPPFLTSSVELGDPVPALVNGGPVIIEVE
jgi:hypothetical protein